MNLKLTICVIRKCVKEKLNILSQLEISILLQFKYEYTKSV